MVTAIHSGLREFFENPETGEPEAKISDGEGKEKRVPLCSIQAMKWLDMCIGENISAQFVQTHAGTYEAHI